MNFLKELHDLFEKSTPGLEVGGFLLDVNKGTITTKIGSKKYVFKGKDTNRDPADLHKSVTGIAKHSQGRALAYLKQHATGSPMSESITLGIDSESDRDARKVFDKIKNFKSKLNYQVVVYGYNATAVNIIEVDENDEPVKDYNLSELEKLVDYLKNKGIRSEIDSDSGAIVILN
jgi:hypothetical protein